MINREYVEKKAQEHDLMLIDWEECRAENPLLLDDTDSPYGIRYYEDPIYGDETSVIAVLDLVAWDCGFYDPWNKTDQAYISEQAQNLGLIPAAEDVWYWANIEASKTLGLET